MPRMPMIAVAATPLLLLLLLTARATPSFAKPVKTTVTPEPTVEEETSYSGNFEENTVTVAVDSDLILTTGDSLMGFTHLPENGLTTTEEPLPDSVLQQLERERAEREQKNRINVTTTEDPNLSSEPNSTAATAALMALVATTTRTIEKPAATTEQASASIMEQSTTTPITKKFDQQMSFLMSPEDLQVEEQRFEMYTETTTFTPDLTTNVDSVAALIDDATSLPLLDEVDPNTSGPIPFDEMMSGTDSMRVEQTTWMQNAQAMAESTTEQDMQNFMTTQQPEQPEQPGSTTEGSNNNTTDLLKNLRIRMESEVQLTSTDEPMPEWTTIGAATESSIIATTEAVAETTIAPPKQQSMLEATTVKTITKAPETTTMLPDTSTTSTTTTTTSTSTTTSTPSTTTEEIPITTTELRPQATRAPRIERIFNTDGVEVLYGYSSVVRTNRF